MRKNTFSLVLALLLTTSAYSCPNNVQKVKSGTIANCDGWLVSEPAMQDFAKTDEKLEKSAKLILEQEYLQKLTEAEVDFYKKRSTEVEKALSQSERQKFWIGIGTFALGVAITGIAAKAAIESVK